MSETPNNQPAETEKGFGTGLRAQLQPPHVRMLDARRTTDRRERRPIVGSLCTRLPGRPLPGAGQAVGRLLHVGDGG